MFFFVIPEGLAVSVIIVVIPERAAARVIIIVIPECRSRESVFAVVPLRNDRSRIKTLRDDDHRATPFNKTPGEFLLFPGVLLSIKGHSRVWGGPQGSGICF